MSDTIWKDHDVVQAYDEQFFLLESARKEYDQAVVGVLEKVHEKLRNIVATDGAEVHDVQLFTEIASGPGFAQHLVRCGLKIADKPARVSVIGRIGTPWGGKTGCIEVGVETSFDPRQARLTLGELCKGLNQDPLGDEESEGLEPIAIGKEANQLNGKAICAGDFDIPEASASSMFSLANRLVRYAKQIDADERKTERLKGILERSRVALSASRALADFKVNPSVPWWPQGEQHYIQIDSSGKPSFWVGYLVKEGSLLYGHNRANESLYSGFSRNFAQAAGVGVNKEYGGQPAGVLFEESVLAAIGDEELIKKIVGYFEFYVLTIENYQKKTKNGTAIPDVGSPFPDGSENSHKTEVTPES